MLYVKSRLLKSEKKSQGSPGKGENRLNRFEKKNRRFHISIAEHKMLNVNIDCNTHENFKATKRN